MTPVRALHLEGPHFGLTGRDGLQVDLRACGVAPGLGCQLRGQLHEQAEPILGPRQQWAAGRVGAETDEAFVALEVRRQFGFVFVAKTLGCQTQGRQLALAGLDPVAHQGQPDFIAGLVL
jgi:hypothetical protein